MKSSVLRGKKCVGAPVECQKKKAKRNLIGDEGRRGACASEIVEMHRLIGQSASENTFPWLKGA
jgi:hypothetical protein